MVRPMVAHHLACRAALTVVELLQQGAIENAASMGERMIQGFKTKLEGLDVQVNGQRFNDWFTITKTLCRVSCTARDEEKLLLNVTADSVIRLLPALNISA
jgi:acetylornithine/N-succinyldiaminopimelate aminotransferase